MSLRNYLLLVLLALLSGNAFAQFGDTSSTNIFSDSSVFRLSLLPVNTPGPDFGFMPYQNGFVFSTARNNRFGAVYSTPDSMNPLLDLYVTEKKDSAFTTPVPFPGPVNSVYNEGPATFSPDGKTMCFTSNIYRSESKRGKNVTGIYESNFKNGKWSKPVLLSFCDTAANYMHPAFASGGTLLFFASDRADSYGKFDLYCSAFTGGSWQEPINLGQTVNTGADDYFPFVSTHFLYFSSTRPGGKGGSDIYKYDLDQRVMPSPLPAPFNSAADDLAFYCDADEQTGFFASNRNESLLNDEIYSYRITLPEPVRWDTIRRTSYCYTFSEGFASLSGDTAGMTYEWQFSDGEKKRGLTVRKCFEKQGMYSVDLNVVEATSGVLFLNELSYTIQVLDTVPLYVEIPDSIRTNQLLSCDASFSKLADCSVLDVYYDFGAGYCKRGKTAEYAYSKEGTNYIRCLFKLRNDSTGKLFYRGVIKKIVVSDNLFAYSHFAADDFKLNTVNVSEVSLALREGDSISFRVYLGSSETYYSVHSPVFDNLKDVRVEKDSTAFVYTSGEEARVKDLIPYYKAAHNAGFKDAVVAGYYRDSLIGGQRKNLKEFVFDTSAYNAISVSKKRNAQMHVDSLRRVTFKGTAGIDSTEDYVIFFDSGKSQVKNEFTAIIDSVFAAYTASGGNIIVNLEAHTDTKGDTDYNLLLSEKRALEVKKFLVQKGIPADAIRTKYYGEYLANDTNEILRRYNRRVGIKISMK
jgi:outer membrane protein OmpA-like peptidoglycan-associated protein